MVEQTLVIRVLAICDGNAKLPTIDIIDIFESVISSQLSGETFDSLNITERISSEEGLDRPKDRVYCENYLVPALEQLKGFEIFHLTSFEHCNSGANYTSSRSSNNYIWK